LNPIAAFYEEQRPDEALRLGDIVSGFAIGTINSPTRESDAFRLEVDKPKAVVMTPACSIGNRTILLAPLKGIDSRWLETPYLAQDLTNINRPMTRLQACPPGQLAKMGAPERAAIQADTTKALRLLAFFVYAPHDWLDSYEVKVNRNPARVGCYMVDFREIHRIKCDEIQSAENSPWRKAKLLQLSRNSRDELRTNLANYFGRPAPEDEV